MAGKKRNQIDTAPMSKTAKASLAKKGLKEGFIAAAPEHLDRVISLARGEYIYLLNPVDGHTHHLRVGSDKYNTIVSTIIETSHGPHVRDELTRKGFPIPEVVNND